MKNQLNYWLSIASITLIVGAVITLGYLFWLTPTKEMGQPVTEETAIKPFPIAPDRPAPAPSIKDLVNNVITAIFEPNPENLFDSEVSKPTKISINNVASVGLSAVNGKKSVLAVDKTGSVYRVEKTTTEKLVEVLGYRITSVVFGGEKMPHLFFELFDEQGTTKHELVSISLGTTTDRGPVYSYKTKPLGQQIINVVSNPEGTRFFLIEKTISGSRGAILDNNFNKIKELFVENYSQWKAFWPSSGFVVVTSKLSEDVPGYSYTFNVTTGEKKKVVGPVTGLETTRSTKGTTAFSSSVATGLDNVRLIDTDGVISEVPVRTTSGKCSWANGDELVCGVPRTESQGISASDWYKGKETSNDDVWVINTKNKTAKLLLRTKDYNLDWDIQTIVFHNEHYYVLNKKDLSLWVFKAPAP